MDEEKLDLRDRIALEILNGLISSGKDQTSTIMADLIFYLVPDEKYLGNQNLPEAAEKRMEKIVRSCYKLADIVRKVRLTAFE